MNMIEVNLAQRGTLPLPSAALVIDMRGITGDDVIDRLRIEIADLANEMKLHEVNHWRYLTEFLSFRQFTPLHSEEVEAIIAQDQSASDATAVNGSGGDIHKKRPGSARDKEEKRTTLFSSESAEFADDGKPSDVFQQHIEELIQETNRVRNNRIAAVNDLNKAGIPGRNMPDATTRVIFLTEANNRESLSSASAYAAKLKEHFVKLERKHHQHLISTTVMCLNASGEEGPPSDLIYGLLWNGKWEHIDSILLSEQYREDAALIEGAMQAYLAELLLYVLLIIPPLTLSVSAPAEEEPQSVPLLEAPDGSAPLKGNWVHLPDATYLVGLATIEHSTRWGRRWINYSLVNQATKLLMDRAPGEDLERKRQRNIVDTWLKNWFQRIEQAIPDKIPGNIAALKAFSNAQAIAQPRMEIFTSRRFSFTISETTIKDLQAYLTDMTDTYASAQVGQTRTYRVKPDADDQATLQDAVDSIPQIERRIREWEDRDTSLRKNTPLLDAQLDAQYVLSNPNFFLGARGSIPRARMQLREMGNAISENKNMHDNNPLDLTTRKEELGKRGKKLIDDLEDHTHGFPLLAGRFGLAGLFVALILILAFFLIGFVAIIGFAWVSQLLPVTDPILVFGASFFAYIFWIVVLLLDIGAVVAIRNALFKNKERSPLSIESIFLLVLILIAACGFLLYLSSTAFTSDQAFNSLAMVNWITPFIHGMSIICLTIAIIIALLEIAYFLWWSDRLLTDRKQVVSELQNIYQQDVADVRFFIAETIGLQLLYYAGLTDRKGGPGSYYNRIDLLYKRFGEIEREADHQQRLAARRLSMSISELQPGAAINADGTWLNLKIREEWLDVNALADSFKGLKERMGKEDSELGDLAEILLSIMGEVTPIEVERQFREKIAASSEIRYIRAFMTALVATTLRFSIAPQSISSIDPLIERYENLDSQYVHRLPGLSILIDTLSKKVREATVQPLLDEDEDSDTQKPDNSPETLRANSILATNALALWEQTLWENMDSKLPNILARSGVLAKLMESEEYDARAVMRRLQARTALFGRSASSDHPGEFRLILSPSAHSRTFRQSLGIPSRLIIDFPDIERLLLLYIQRYESDALFVPLAEPPDGKA
jgi:hypothetical protein